MSIPDFQSMMLPLSETISDGRSYSNPEVADALAARFGVTDEELRQPLPSGEQTTFGNRVAWAKTHLKKAGLLESPSRGNFLITQQGRDVVNKRPQRVDIRFLKQFPSYDWHKRDGQPKEDIAEADDNANRTPEELLEESYLALRAKLADELLEKVKECSPIFFERLVVDLLVAMGYGGSRKDAGKAIGRSGDGGIDGIINEDRLGLDVVCIQAKRWRDNSVGREAVQAFAGSMEGHRAKKGVFITTSSFSKHAIEYVQHIERKIVLIDGERLAELMIDHGIGVTTKQTYSLKTVDTDFFTEED